MFSFKSLTLLVNFICIFGASYENTLKETGEMDFDITEYGDTWIYFPDGDGTPRKISLRTPPTPFNFLRQSTSNDIEYRLYTRYNVDQYVLLDEFAAPVNVNGVSHIVGNLQKAPIVLITHGWESSADKDAVINMKDAYLETRDVNIIAVDWSAISNSFVYPIVAPQTASVGNSVGIFLDYLSQRYNVFGDQIHLIGHSLGAHVMGNAGHTSNLTVSRITGLDPARPLFEFPSIPTNHKLDPSDAQFVDVIHTCGGVLGVEDPTGHADFYPNSGHPPQPGCADLKYMLEACSHSRSHYLYTDSIRYPNSYPAYSCPNWNVFLRGECEYAHTNLGIDANRSAYGTFYMATNDQKPYGRGLIYN